MSERQKTALITGASSGIGYSIAIEFAKRGYKVFAGARRLGPMESLKQYGVIPIELDVSSLESVKGTKKYLLEHTDGYLDVLYNNAGQSCTFPAIDVTDEWFTKCYEVNVFGAMRMTRELSPLIINAKGTIGFTGLVSGLIPFPFSSIYLSSKAAIHAYAGALRLEMKPFGVKVINIVTGGVKTNIADTRPLPTDSYFNIPEIEKSLKARREMAVRNNPISAEKFAYQVANDFENASVNGALNYYRGAKAFFLGFLLLWCPRIIVEWGLVRRFHLQTVFRILSDKFSKQKLA